MLVTDGFWCQPVPVNAASCWVVRSRRGHGALSPPGARPPLCRVARSRTGCRNPNSARASPQGAPGSATKKFLDRTRPKIRPRGGCSEHGLSVGCEHDRTPCATILGVARSRRRTARGARPKSVKQQRRDREGARNHLQPHLRLRNHRAVASTASPRQPRRARSVATPRILGSGRASSLKGPSH